MTPDPPKSLKIALLTYRGKVHCGGQGVYVRHLAKNLAELGHNVEVFSGQPYPELPPEIKLHRLPSLDIFNDAHPGRLPGFWEIKTLADLAEVASFCTGAFPEPLAFSLRVLKSLKNRLGEFDLVHDNQSLGYGLLSLEKRGLPLIATIHHPITIDRELEMAHARTKAERFSKDRWYSFTKMQNRVACRIERILTVTEATKRDIHRTCGVPLKNLNVVPVGVDTNLFRPIPGIAREPERILTTTSADVPLKGLAILLESLAKLRTEREVRLTVVGTLKPGGAVEQTLDRLGIASAVDFVSGISDDELVETYARCSAAVVPSLYEGFSLPAIEAMATGIPLVATTGGGLAEVVGPDGESAILAEPGDVDSLTAAIRRVLDEPQMAARLGESGRKRVKKLWSWPRTAELTAEQYYLRLESWQKQAKDGFGSMATTSQTDRENERKHYADSQF